MTHKLKYFFLKMTIKEEHREYEKLNFFFICVRIKDMYREIYNILCIELI